MSNAVGFMYKGYAIVYSHGHYCVMDEGKTYGAAECLTDVCEFIDNFLL